MRVVTVLPLLESARQAEEEVAALYHAIGERFASDPRAQNFFRQMEKEEHDHARMLELVKGTLEPFDGISDEDMPAPLPLLLSRVSMFRNWVHYLIGVVATVDVDVSWAILAARSVESDEQEHIVNWLLDLTRHRLLRALIGHTLASTAGHMQRVLDFQATITSDHELAPSG